MNIVAQINLLLVHFRMAKSEKLAFKLWIAVFINNLVFDF